MEELNTKKWINKKIIVAVIAAAVAILCIIVGVLWYNAPAQKIPRLLDLGQKYLQDEEYELAVATGIVKCGYYLRNLVSS